MPSRSRSGPAAIAALFLTGTVATMVAGLKPILVTAYITSIGLTPKQAGFVVAAEMTGATLGNLAAAWLVSRFSNRRCALMSLVLLGMCDLGCVLSLRFPFFLSVRLIAGLAEGTAAGVMAATAAGMIAPDRLMAAYLVLSLATFAGGFVVVPRLLLRGIQSVFLLLSASVLPAICLNAWFPATANEKLRSRNLDGSIPAFHAALALLGTMLFYAATGALWPFMGEVGRSAHLSTTEVGSALGISQIAGAAAGLFPLALGTKLGRSIPLGAALLIGTISVASLALFHSPSIYWVGVPLFMASLMIFFPYIMGVMAQLDPSGRLATVSFALQSVGLAVGPAIAGRMAMTVGYVAVLWAGVGCFPLAWLALAPVTMSQDREISRA